MNICVPYPYNRPVMGFSNTYSAKQNYSVCCRTVPVSARGISVLLFMCLILLVGRCCSILRPNIFPIVFHLRFLCFNLAFYFDAEALRHDTYISLLL